MVIALHPNFSTADERLGASVADTYVIGERRAAAAVAPSPGQIRLMRFSVGIDVGGTFTDLVLADAAASWCCSTRRRRTPSDPSTGRLARPRASSPSASGCRSPDVPRPGRPDRPRHDGHDERDAHRRGARTGLLTTEGFRDILEMRRGVRSRRAPLRQQVRRRRAPLVPRYLRLPVRERVDVARRRCGRRSTSDGVARGGRRAASPRASRRSPSASCTRYANAAHEARARSIVRERAPGVFLVGVLGDPAAGPPQRPRRRRP